MKNLFNRCFVLMIAVWLLAIQAGIPVYKMVCTEDGHTSIALAPALMDCEDEDDCCKPVVQKAAQNHSCCEINQSLIKLQVCPTVYEPVLTTGHWIPSVAIAFAPVSISPVSHASTPDVRFHLRKQSTQSVIQVFRI